MTMTKKVAVINDLSGLGRCSLTAAISVLSAMGIQTCPLPTAILSSQTEYPSYYCYDFTDKMDYFRQEWKKLGTCFSGIYTGYIASVPQIEEIFHFLDTFQTPDTFLLVDPVMGDDGMTYDMYTSEFLSAMKELTARADVITPNITEFCLLTDMDYNTLQNSSLSLHQLISCLKDASHTLLTAERAKKILITGIRFTTDDGIPKIWESPVRRLFAFSVGISLLRWKLFRYRRSLCLLYHRWTCPRNFPYRNDADCRIFSRKSIS